MSGIAVLELAVGRGCGLGRLSGTGGAYRIHIYYDSCKYSAVCRSENLSFPRRIDLSLFRLLFRGIALPQRFLYPVRQANE